MNTVLLPSLLRSGSVGKDRGGNRCHGRNVLGLLMQRVTRLCCERAHLPIAGIDCVTMMLLLHLRTHLIIEATFRFKMVEELLVCFTSPEVHVGDFKVAPDYCAKA